MSDTFILSGVFALRGNDDDFDERQTKLEIRPARTAGFVCSYQERAISFREETTILVD